MTWNIFEKLRSITWTRDIAGTNTYLVNQQNGSWANYDKLSNLDIAQNHPILTPAMLFVSKLFAQAEFKVVNKDTGKEKANHWLTKLLKKPNAYQTQNDFLESLQFIQIAQGKAVGYLKRPIGFDKAKDIESIYILDSDKIKWPENYRSSFIASTSSNLLDNQKITYDPDGENFEISVKDLLFFYDLPNCLNKNFYETRSRVDGLRQTLINTQDSLIAKNIILKTNGKEILSSGSNDSFPLAGDDKKQAESLLHNNYGLGWNRKRGIVTKASVTYQSMHIALRDLGLDESVKVDGNIIYTALHIPKDIISLEAKKTTYNNFKESMVSYVQNEMQANLNSFIEVLQELLEDTNLELVGTYEHLPIMQFILKERWEAHKVRAEALSAYLASGMPQEVALELLGFDKSVTLEEIKQEVNNENTQSNGGEEE
jgi:rRNA pseudouridine-1189 N-methylase Emg1 (Nep1/Mra1 family)